MCFFSTMFTAWHCLSLESGVEGGGIEFLIDMLGGIVGWEESNGIPHQGLDRTIILTGAVSGALVLWLCVETIHLIDG